MSAGPRTRPKARFSRPPSAQLCDHDAQAREFFAGPDKAGPVVSHPGAFRGTLRRLGPPVGRDATELARSAICRAGPLTSRGTRPPIVHDRIQDHHHPRTTTTKCGGSIAQHDRVPSTDRLNGDVPDVRPHVYNEGRTPIRENEVSEEEWSRLVSSEPEWDQTGYPIHRTNDSHRGSTLKRGGNSRRARMMNQWSMVSRYSPDRPAPCVDMAG